MKKTFREAFKSCKTDADIRRVEAVISKDIKDKKITLDDVSLRGLGQSLLGEAAMDKLATMNDGGLVTGLKESVAPGNLSAFTNITGLLVLEKSYTAFTSAEFIGDSLCEQESSNEDHARRPGLAFIDDEAMVVEEGEEYPDTKFGEDYIDVPSSQKRGLKIGLTREMIFFDRTGELGRLASAIGQRVGQSKEVRTLSIVTGVTNNFIRKGTARNTYVSSADPRINDTQSAAVALLDETNIEAAEQLFANMTDDRTVGEPISGSSDTIIVTKFKEATAGRIVSASSFIMANGNNHTVASPTMGRYKIITSQWLQWVLVNKGLVSAANAKQYWFIGQPKKAFVYRTLFPFAVTQAAANSDADFERDIVAQWKVSERGVAYVQNPWYMVRQRGHA